jgi:hypothetical protein
MTDPDRPEPPSPDHAGAPGPGNRTYKDPVVLVVAALAVIALVIILVTL